MARHVMVRPKSEADTTRSKREIHFTRENGLPRLLVSSRSSGIYFPSRQIPSACWAGRSEIENNTESFAALCA
jgi:hypothetical protein